MGEFEVAKFGFGVTNPGSSENKSQCGVGAAKIEPNEFGIPLSVTIEDIETLNNAYSRGLPEEDKRFRLPVSERGSVFCYKFDQPKFNQVDTEQAAHMSGENDFPSCEEVLIANPLADEICKNLRARMADYVFQKEPWYKDLSSVLVVSAVVAYGGSVIVGMGFHDGGALSQARHGLDAALRISRMVAADGSKLISTLGAGGTVAAVIIAAEVGALVYVGVKNHELNDKIFVMANASGYKTAVEDNGPSVFNPLNASFGAIKDADGKVQLAPEKDSKMAKPAFKNPEIVMEFGPPDKDGKIHPLVNTDGTKVWHWEEKN